VLPPHVGIRGGGRPAAGCPGSPRVVSRQRDVTNAFRHGGLGMCSCIHTQASGAVYGLLLAVGGQVVVLERGKGAPALDHKDVLLLDNFVRCNPTFRCGPTMEFAKSWDSLAETSLCA